MVLYLEAETRDDTVTIEAIDFVLNNGKEVMMTWDESDISRHENGFSAKFKGVEFNEKYANGNLGLVKGGRISDIRLYSEKKEDIPFKVTGMLFDDYGERCSIDLDPRQTF